MGRGGAGRGGAVRPGRFVAAPYIDDGPRHPLGEPFECRGPLIPCRGEPAVRWTGCTPTNAVRDKREAE